jgi:competence protein ComEC
MREIRHLKNPIFWLALSVIAAWVAVWQWPDDRLHLVFCDVGQGDAALITFQNNQLLIDGGPSSEVLNCLGEHLPFWDRKIEMLVATHPDADHITGLIDVIERYDVRYLLVNSLGKDSGVFEEFKQAVLSEGTAVYFPKKGDVIKLKEVELAVIWPPSQERVLGATNVEREANETSTVIKLSYGDFDALFPGDIGSQTEAQLELSDIEVLKVPHHGSKYSTSLEFLEKTTPELAIISVGKNSFGHPTREVIERLSDQAIKLLRTDLEGEIELVTDGKTWGVTQ